MTRVELLLAGVPGRTDQGYLGQSTVALVDGRTLVDTGGPSRRPLLEATLDAVGVDPAAVEDVLLTHLHFDHCDNLDLFPGATVHVHGPELDRVAAGGTDWATSVAAPRLLDGRDVVRFEAGETVAGFEALSTPGHAEHHVSFLAATDGTRFGLVGDAVKNLREFRTRAPTAIHDATVAAETIDRLAERLDLVVPGHDVPFYVDADGGATPCGDVELTVSLQAGGDAGVRVGAATDRTDPRPLPSFVHDRTGTLG
jgi:glyoxylase-like metal-dependent hydrolase (beta-lactamase superfamily II)